MNIVESNSSDSVSAWLVLAVGENRQYVGNEGYMDEPSERYVWDSTVPNHRLLKPGDILVLWDKRCLLGASVIEKINVQQTTKTRLRCPSCGKTGFKERKKNPKFRCPTKECGNEFDVPVYEEHVVTEYTSHHGEAWVDLPGLIGGDDLRLLCFKQKTQHSLRELNWNKFLATLGCTEAIPTKTILERRRANIIGGHVKRLVRTRKGQAGFRRNLLNEFGATCAFTGPCPANALEAAHLYSYAAHGEHRDGGGLLMRRDIHTLFDNGLVAVAEGGRLIRIHPTLKQFPVYAQLDNQPLKIRIRRETKACLGDHFEQHAQAYDSLVRG